MGSLQWILHNWFELLSSVGIVGGLLFTGHSLRSETKTRRIANLLSLTKAHRDIWTQEFDHPELARVLDAKAAIRANPVTQREQIFVNLVIQHLSVVFHAMQDELTINAEELRRDVSWFFSLPIPAYVWELLKGFQNDRFREFVESCRASAQSDPQAIR